MIDPRDNLSKGRKYLKTTYLNKGLNVKIYKKLKPIPAEHKKYKKIGKRHEQYFLKRGYTLVYE